MPRRHGTLCRRLSSRLGYCRRLLGVSQRHKRVQEIVKMAKQRAVHNTARAATAAAQAAWDAVSAIQFSTSILSQATGRFSTPHTCARGCEDGKAACCAHQRTCGHASRHWYDLRLRETQRRRQDFSTADRLANPADRLANPADKLAQTPYI